ncbi:hypothetical protein M0812_05840 [Anaeramoeba flamelloides]|uniref:J domain-containing protein n=1 Tax=Anaeramoeba flamelloides TaxID=1746091 RepID=A0AAV8A7A0_9EUKA|nr:hypothetical protein M0812_05840 [Anaeramoeba flamelloides]
MSREINKILNSKTHYETLGVAPNCDTDTLRKVYRNLTINYHPDKCKNGLEVFKKIKKAFECLSKPELRKEYDESLLRSKQIQQNHRSLQKKTIHQNVNKGKIFEKVHNQNGFFHNQFGFFYNDKGKKGNQSQSSNLKLSLQIIPIVLIVILIYFYLNSKTNGYEELVSLSPQDKFWIKRNTNKREVVYYVSNDFKKDITKNKHLTLDLIENYVEITYENHLKKICSKKLNNLIKVKKSANKKISVEDINNTKSLIEECRKLKAFENKIR